MPKRFVLPQLLSTIVALFFLSTPGFATDHSKFFKEKFEFGQDVTLKCLECHKDAAQQVMKTSHWTWSLEQEIDGKKVRRGKINSFNNYCVSVYSNLAVCASCHIGYGWTDHEFDFEDEENVDCLVCHDSTGAYKKNARGPLKRVDLLLVAQNVARPERGNCGTCHFFGGGGDAIKHGDLDSSMDFPSRDLDVHMDYESNDFMCQDCHVTKEHQISGNAMTVSPTGQTGIGCNGCHTEAVHKSTVLNNHTAKVACQTCHIPEYAKELPTKTSWDWSTAGQSIRPKKDKYGKENFMKKKGNFTYDMHITPAYAWYNGTSEVYQQGDKISTDLLRLTAPNGHRNDPKAKIYPFKVHTGKQPYDPENKILITPKLIGKDGFWKTYDWESASRIGMEETGLPFSGKIGFIATEMYWPLNHMVSPADKALSCDDCHGFNGRLDWQALGYSGDPD